jgi:hypothetical protein
MNARNLKGIQVEAATKGKTNSRKHSVLPKSHLVSSTPTNGFTRNGKHGSETQKLLY